MQGIFIKSPILKIALGILAALASIILLLLVLLTEDVRMADQTDNWAAREIENGALLYANNCASCHGPDGKGLTGVAPALNSHYFFTDTGRLVDVGYIGSLEDYIHLTVAAGRPSKGNSQWAQKMPTWGSEFGGPMRNDQVVEVAKYVMNYRDEALAQTPEEDPFQPFQDVHKPVGEQSIAVLMGAEPPPPAEGTTTEPGAVREPAQLFSAMACAGCHMLDQPQDASNRGPVGPNLGNLADVAGTLVAGMSAEDYVYQSITDPSAFVVEGYVDGIMPKDFTTKMSEEEIRGLVAWLLDPNK
ncbi:MAG: c-type cytochrome [Caldilineaceae bacterium]|nr:c-type cytochrome [Caldilineaceae bacterium]